MALFYQSGRVSRFAVGVPGFSTNRDLVLDVDGAVGIDTQKPRGSIDTPEISIRGDIIDSAQEVGANAYYLSRDEFGVRWRAGNPSDLQIINVQDDGVQVGLGSFDTLNFIGKNDEFVVEIEEDPGNSQVANIVIDARFTRNEYDGNFSLSTSFGSDGTFWSLPGYGTTEATGITSIGIGTNAPSADLQVGIGSTGVRLYGAEGRVQALIGDFENIKISGNLEAESLVIDPGISTFRGNIDAQGISSFTGPIIAGLGTFDTLDVQQLLADRVYAGLTTLGVGGTDTYVLGDLYVQGGIGTFDGDVFIGGDLTVEGRTFFKEINAEFIEITGIATIREYESLVGQSTFFSAGVATAGQIGFNTGIGTALTVGFGSIGILTSREINSDDAFIGFASMGNAFVGGAVTVTRVDVEQVEIERAEVGVLTVTEGLDSQGFSTFVGFATFGDDIYVAGFGTFGEGVDIPFVQVEDLIVSGVATVRQLEYQIGIGSFADIDNAFVGVGTFDLVVTEDLEAEGGSIGGIDFPGTGEIEGDYLDFDFGRIGILTGDIFDYYIGFVTYLSAGVGTISTIRGDNIIIDDPIQSSFINGVEFNDFFGVSIPRRLTVDNSNFVASGGTFGDAIWLGDVEADPTVGMTTVAGDLYVGNDFFVRGTQFIDNLVTENIYVAGVATVNELQLAIGIVTSIEVDNLDVGVSTTQNATGDISTFRRYDAETIAVTDDPTKYPNASGQLYADRAFFEFSNSFNANVGTALTVGFDGFDNGVIDLNGRLIVSGVTTLSDDTRIEGDLTVTGLTTTTDLYVSGIATINELDVDNIEADTGSIGVGTIGDLIVNGSADFQGDVVVDIGGTANINEGNIGFASIINQVVGTSTVGFISFTDAVGSAATIGIVSATDIETEIIDTTFLTAGVGTVGLASIGVATDSNALYVTGISTFQGITSFIGDVSVDGDLSVTGVTSFPQIDALQAQIGILTVFTLADLNGIVDAESVAITSNFQSTAGVSTLGFTTISDLYIDNGLFVNGITTFNDTVNIDKVEFVELSVTGVATIGELNFGVGIGSTLTVIDLTVEDELTVDGPAGFNGQVTILNNLNVESGVVTAGSLVVNNDASIAIGSIGVATIGVATVGFASITEEIVGVSTVTLLDAEDIQVEQLLVNQSEFTGVATFRSDVDIDADVDISGQVEIGDLVVSGVSTLNIIDATSAEIDAAIITDATISTSRIGFSSVGIITVGFGATTDGSFFRTGVGTIVGFTTITGDVFIDGNQTITGVSSYSQLDAEQSRIGILTITNFLDVNGDLDVSGITTMNGFIATTGIVTDLTIVNLDVTGVATIPTLNVTDLDVSRNLVVGGISTLGSANTITGFTTTLGDLYVGGDLYVQDDIFYDEITGRNLSISGIATINDLRASVGVITDLSGAGSIGYPVGVITDLTSTDATITNLDVVNADLDALNVSGLSTFVGLATFKENVVFEKDISVAGLSTFVGDILGSDIFLSGVAAGIGLSFTNGAIDNAFAGIITATDANITGVGTFNLLTGIGVSAVTVDTTFLNSVQISNSGLTTTNTLQVYGNTTLENVFINETVSIGGTVTFNEELIVNENIFQTIGVATLNQLQVSTNANVTGILSAFSLNVNGGEFFASGVSTFQNGLDVNNTLNAETIRYTTGIGSVADIEVADIEFSNLGITTVNYADVTNQQVGILSVTTEIEYNDVSTVKAVRTQAQPAIQTIIYAFDTSSTPTPPTTFEFLIQARDYLDYHSTKIIAVTNPATGDASSTEYATVTTNDELAAYAVELAGNILSVRAVPIGINTTTYSVHATAIDNGVL